jgi:hypothetical protein
MRLNSVSVRTTEGTVRLVGEVESDRCAEPFELYFEFPIEHHEFVRASADVFAAAMLVPAMFQNEDLRIAPPISPRLLFNLPRLRDVFHAWHPQLRPSEIHGLAEPPEQNRTSRRAATFFSGGVDSFYTLLKHLRKGLLPAPLTHVIFMRGIEKPLDFGRGIEDSQREVEAIAAAAGVSCIAGETNIRSYFEPDWLHQYCGSGLAATALALGNGFNYVCIPSTYSYGDFVPIGSTPLTDERFSTEYLEIVHDGAELTRTDKLAKIVQWNPDLVLAHLRVCAQNRGGPYNCGECWKCVRTAVPLAYLGALEQASMFPNKSTAHWESVLEMDSLPFVLENLRFARKQSRLPQLTALLERIVRRRQFRRHLRTAVENSPVRPLVPTMLQVRRAIRNLVKGR